MLMKSDIPNAGGSDMRNAGGVTDVMLEGVTYVMLVGRDITNADEERHT